MIVVGVDLGQSKDYTTIVVCRRTATNPNRWEVPYLERLPLGTSYVDATQRIVELVSRPKLERCFLAIDRTGVGAPVCDMLRSKLPIGLGIRLWPICLTAGQVANSDGRGGTNVPKKDVIATVQVLLQSKRLSIARELPLAETLVREMADYQVKITAAANETMGAWREGQHDDLVLALGIALWLGETLQNDPDQGIWEILDEPIVQADLTRETAIQKIIREVEMRFDDD